MTQIPNTGDILAGEMMEQMGLLFIADENYKMAQLLGRYFGSFLDYNLVIMLLGVSFPKKMKISVVQKPVHGYS